MCAKYVHFHLYKCMGVYICVCMHQTFMHLDGVGVSIVYVFLSIQINHIWDKSRVHFMTE